MLKGLLRGLKRDEPAPVPGRAGEDATALLAQALAAYRRGDKLESARRGREALERDPASAPAWSLLGRIASEERDTARAIECYAEVLALRPDDPDYLVDAAEIHRRAGQLGRALDLSARALELRAEDRRAWQVRGAALEALGRLDEAVRCLQQELRLAPQDADAHSNLLHLLNRSGLWEAEAVAAEHRAWGARHADALTPARPSCPARRWISAASTR